MVYRTLVESLSSGKGTPLFYGAYKCLKSTIMKETFQTPSPRGIIAQRNKVNTFRELFLNNLDSPHVEIYRKAWAKARARLSEMQAAIHFCRKEVCHE
jgi:transposase